MSSASGAPKDTTPDLVTELLEAVLAFLWRLRVEVVRLGVPAASFRLARPQPWPDPGGESMISTSVPATARTASAGFRNLLIDRTS